jgi:hypothetical protein
MSGHRQTHGHNGAVKAEAVKFRRRAFLNGLGAAAYAVALKTYFSDLPDSDTHPKPPDKQTLRQITADIIELDHNGQVEVRPFPVVTDSRGKHVQSEVNGNAIVGLMFWMADIEGGISARRQLKQFIERRPLRIEPQMVRPDPITGHGDTANIAAAQDYDAAVNLLNDGINLGNAELRQVGRPEHIPTVRPASTRYVIELDPAVLANPGKDRDEYLLTKADSAYLQTKGGEDGQLPTFEEASPTVRTGAAVLFGRFVVKTVRQAGEVMQSKVPFTRRILGHWAGRLAAAGGLAWVGYEAAQPVYNLPGITPDEAQAHQAGTQFEQYAEHFPPLQELLTQAVVLKPAEG